MSDEPRDQEGEAEPTPEEPAATPETRALRGRLQGVIRESGLTPRELDHRLGLPAGTISRLLDSAGDLEPRHVAELREVLGLPPGEPVTDASPSHLTAQEVVAALERHGLPRRRQAAPGPSATASPAPPPLDIEKLAALIGEAVDAALRRSS